MRLDTATILTRFFSLEEALTRGVAGWIPALHRLESKAALARLVWEDALTANALRDRVFELKYPSRLLQLGADAPLAVLFRAVGNAPSAIAVVQALTELFNPALLDAYRGYLAASDLLADGPTYRFLVAAIADKASQAQQLQAIIDREPGPAASEQEATGQWVAALRQLLGGLGGVRLDGTVREHLEVPEIVAPGRAFALAEEPARDDHYHLCTYYWPDVVDPDYPYGEGLALQLRSGVSHLNEVWAVETAGAILTGLAEPLGWEFVHDAARWLYDESRHMTMGQRRLDAWRLPREEVPLGDYIYLASRGEDVIYRMGMLGYFEAKNIGKKQVRARAFEEMGDRASQLDMDFDWADETLHAEYGRRWMKRLLEVRGQDEDGRHQVLAHCEDLVAAIVAKATLAQRAEIRDVAGGLVEHAAQLAAAAHP
jgi:hypothetical protein